jgi:hypothetical protein
MRLLLMPAPMRRGVYRARAPPFSKTPTPGLVPFSPYHARPPCSVPLSSVANSTGRESSVGVLWAWQLCRGARWWARAHASSAWPWLARCTPPGVTCQVPSLGARRLRAARHALLPEPASPHPYRFYCPWPSVGVTCPCRCRTVDPCLGALCPVRMAHTLHAACRFSSPALLSLRIPCSSLLFSLGIILYFFTFSHLHNTSGSGSSGKVVGTLKPQDGGPVCVSSWIGRTHRHACGAPSYRHGDSTHVFAVSQ